MVLLAACVVILGVAVVGGGGRSRRETYRRAVEVASVTSGRGEGTVPLRLGGTRWLSARYAGVLVAVPTLLALWATLGAADGRGSGTSAVLAEAGAVIVERPIVKIENEVAEGSSPRAAATADYTVLLPSPTGRDGVPATFEAYTNRRQGVGSELYVAYVPERPELGAIGDDRRQDVERQLAGRAVEVGDAWGIGGLWALVTLALLAGWWKINSMRRPARTVGPDWEALRVTVTGAGEHTDAPPPGSAAAADERKRKENTRRLKGLVLDGRGREIPFHSQMASEPAGDALSGAHGWLLWSPRQRRGRDVLAELVGDDGWQLPGAVPVQVAEQVAEAGLTVPAHPDPERRVRTLDLGAGWLVTASVPVVAGWAVALGCLAALLFVPDGGAWRPWTVAVGLLAPIVGHIMRGMASGGGGDQAG
ncbi:hypothetical protein H1D24_03510 [Streptomyces sp. PSKA28]|uniref:Uncharacterized protein n=1 Tax=Streptomyces himalayensis subsp. himalayensis TaxID=2756131 RepID=A0A7W0I7D9_9ACTN|nr:hypothetical protein [Streptomyces himalayensis subsp. himalayensis]